MEPSRDRGRLSLFVKSSFPPDLREQGWVHGMDMGQDPLLLLFHYLHGQILHREPHKGIPHPP